MKSVIGTAALAPLIAVLAVVAMFCITRAAAEEPQWRHGGVLFGTLKYGPDFSHYDHVNPDAPKGGTYNQGVPGNFDSFNPFVVRGRPAAGLTLSGGLLYDTLFEQSVDQPSASYGLVAQAFRHAPNFSWAAYRLNPDARFHDGEPIKPEDVIWSLEVLKRNQPLYTKYYGDVVRAEKTGEHEVTFTFAKAGNRELPHIMGDLPVLPKHWWEGTDADGNPRNIDDPTTEPPLGSGPYRIAGFDIGKTVTWERVDDYWAADLPVRKGRFNFNRIHYTYFLDRNALWEAFKKGGISDTRAENVSRRWQTEYIFPAFERGDVEKAVFAEESSQTFQAYFFNTRRSKFADVRVRKALNLLYNFEALNKTQFFGAYTRTDSYFEGGELQHGGTRPQGRVKEILEEYRGQIDDAIIDEAFALPVLAGASDVRKAQRQALKLFREAGYQFRDGKMVDGEGKQFTLEILGNNPTDERIGNPVVESFRKLGIEASLRIVDSAQYKQRIDNFDFDVTSLLTRQSLSPGNEQRDFWSTAAADLPGARNYAGIRDEVVDELIERVIAAPDRDELVALTRALDQVLMHGYYTIPMWHNPTVWYAWWRKIKFPPTQPVYTGIDPYSLWIDEEAEEALNRASAAAAAQ